MGIVIAVICEPLISSITMFSAKFRFCTDFVHSTVETYKAKGGIYVYDLLVSYTNFILLVPPDKTSFVGRNKCYKVGVRDY